MQCEAKKWGNSIGVILPKVLVDQLDIRPNEFVSIEVSKPLKVKDVFGIIPPALRDSNRNTQKVKDELRKEWSKW